MTAPSPPPPSRPPPALPDQPPDSPGRPALDRESVRVAFTLVLALAAACLCVWLRTPLPWMIGPLLATAFASMLGGPTASWTPLRNIGQWTIGCALGLYFTPQVVALVAGLWWAILLGIFWALGLGVAVGKWLYRVHHGPGPFHVAGLSRTTTYFASHVGGASEMTLMSERHGGQPELVACAHSVRILLVTLIIPFGFQWAGLHGMDSIAPGLRVVNPSGLALLAVATGLGCLAVRRVGMTNPWFLGALLVSLLFTACGVTLSTVPQSLTNAAQLVIGISLGVRFTRSFMHLAPRWLGSIALSTIVMILLSGAFAWVLAQAVGLHWATLMLGTAPGGIAEMTITAKVLQLGVPVVTAFQVTRLAAVLFFTEPVFRWFYKEGDGHH
ncbi:MAG: AbrB family transcriptional regulator [Comamonadaceae bacterium]|nr:MAG: AbrB family transcriptional regulator [Comamonadaceae bacterium]